MTKTSKARLEWVDVLKALGMFSIYLAHTNDYGKFFSFSNIVVAPLFFFTAGFFAQKRVGDKPKEFILHQAQGLLAPYYFFTVIYLVILLVKDRPQGAQLKSLVWSTVFGVRGHTPTGGRWFLVCLFVVTVLFYFLKKIFHKSWLIVSLSLFLFILANLLLPNNVQAKPSWVFNLDSAMYYLLFYVLGDLLFPPLVYLIGKINTSPLYKILYHLGGALCLFLSVLIYQQKMPTPLPHSPVGRLILSVTLPVIYAFIGMGLALYLSLLLERIPLIPKIGRDSLLLCCNETLYRSLLLILLGLLGVDVTKMGSLSIMVTIVLVFLVSTYFIHPLQRWFFSQLRRGPSPQA